jgi:adenine-specific DNA-methyltransferase
MTACIVGWGHLPFGKHEGRDVESLIVEAATLALGDAGVAPADVDEIVLGHFNGGFVRWPKPGGRKPNAILDTERTQELLVPSAIYVLVKRFTSKEERRRVVACIYDPHRIRAERVGFENHLNYFHARGRGLPMDFAKGLAAFLNSTLVDVYFRQFNGHTQVNATDLRNMCYPTRAELESLGRKIADAFPNQAELDALVERELL